jgi:circadian clock protein KaiB
MPVSERTAAQPEQEARPVKYKLRLFIAGNEPNSALARKNIQEICAAHLDDNYELELIDVFESFQAAIEERIVVTPALLIDAPKKARVLGNLQDKAKVLAALGLL